VLDAEGKTTVARKLPVVIGNDDPVACAKAEAVEVPIDEKPIEEVVKR
jgi:hypothetical protein